MQLICPVTYCLKLAFDVNVGDCGNDDDDDDGEAPGRLDELWIG